MQGTELIRNIIGDVMKKCECGKEYKKVFSHGMAIEKPACGCVYAMNEFSKMDSAIGVTVKNSRIGISYQKREYYPTSTGIIVHEINEETGIRKKYNLDNNNFVEYYSNVVDNVKRGKNILIYGTPGNGKTTMAIYIGLCAIAAGLSVKYFQAVELCRKGLEFDVLHRPTLVIIDDVGGSKSEGKWGIASAGIDYRIRNDLATIALTNEDSKDIGKIYNESFVDRLQSFHYRIIMNDESKREKGSSDVTKENQGSLNI